jgi:hypothetical protein
MRDIAGIIDIERDGLRRRGVTGAIKIHEDAAQLHDFAQGRRVLPTRYGGLALPFLGVALLGFRDFAMERADIALGSIGSRRRN